MRIDLHCHSNASDGTDPPAEVMRRAHEAGLDVVALTDHDSTRGYTAAREALPDGLTLVLGCELSCLAGDVPVHILGYLFDPEQPTFLEERELIRTDRTRRAHAMLDKLIELGAPISRERVFELAADGAVGRPHMARALVEAGVVPDVKSAFTEEWIADNGRAYVEKHTVDALKGVRLIRDAGGVAAFAHPGAAKRGRIVGDDVVVALAEAGLAAVEVEHPDHDPETRTRVRALAEHLGLLTTGSSDDHGSITGNRLGCETTDPDVYAALVAAATGAAPVDSGGDL